MSASLRGSGSSKGLGVKGKPFGKHDPPALREKDQWERKYPLEKNNAEKAFYLRGDQPALFYRNCSDYISDDIKSVFNFDLPPGNFSI